MIKSKNKAKMSDDEEIMYVDNEVFVTVEETKQRSYHVHIDDYFMYPAYYRKLQAILGNATEDDTVLWHLNSGGGRLDVVLPIYHWMMQSEAHNVAMIEGENASATSLLIMGAASVVAYPHCSLMLHGPAFGTPRDDMQKIVKFVEFEQKRLRGIMEEFYQGFLTQEEIDAISTYSTEIWMDSDEIIERLQRRQDTEQSVTLMDEEDDVEEVIETLKPSKKRTKKKENVE